MHIFGALAFDNACLTVHWWNLKQNLERLPNSTPVLCTTHGSLNFLCVPHPCHLHSFSSQKSGKSFDHDNGRDSKLHKPNRLVFPTFSSQRCSMLG